MKQEIDELIKMTHKLWKEGREREMLPYFEEAIALIRKKNDLPQLIEVLINYAGGLRVSGEYEKALKASYEALDLIEKNYSTKSESYATALMNIANIYRMKGDFYKSEELFLKAEKLLLSLGVDNYSLAGLYNNLSLLYQSLFKYEKAYEYQLKSIEINRRDSKYNVPLGISYNNLYEICKKLNKLDKAAQYLHQAEQTLLKEVGVEHPLYCSVLNNFADLYFQKKNITKSFELYKLILPMVEKFYGKKSEYYASVKSNYDLVKKELNNNTKTCTPKTIPPVKVQIPCEKTILKGKGMEIARNFFENEILPFFEQKYIAILPLLAFGLVGQGSECFGYDDEISRDHDFGKRCCIWLDESINQSLKDNIIKTTSKMDGRVDVYYVHEFYKKYTLYDNGPVGIYEFRKVPSDLLATATNGEVFYDKLGKFTQIRERLLEFYPQDLVYKKMAYALNKMAQSGQYNYIRCLKRNDHIGSEIALSEFITYYSHFMHLINKKYMPFYKWYKRSLESLQIYLGDENSAVKLEKLISLNFDDRINYIEKMCVEIREYLNKKGLSKNNNDFLLTQAPEVAHNILDDDMRNEDTWVL